MDPLWHNHKKDWDDDRIAALGVVITCMAAGLGFILLVGWIVVSLIRWML